MKENVIVSVILFLIAGGLGMYFGGNGGLVAVLIGEIAIGLSIL